MPSDTTHTVHAQYGYQNKSYPETADDIAAFLSKQGVLRSGTNTQCVISPTDVSVININDIFDAAGAKVPSCQVNHNTVFDLVYYDDNIEDFVHLIRKYVE